MSGLSVESRNCTLESCVDIEPFGTFRPILVCFFVFADFCLLYSDELFLN